MIDRIPRRPLVLVALLALWGGTDASAAGTRAPPPAAARPAQPAPGAAASAATPGTVTRDTELKAEPFVDARTLAALRAKSPVSIVERRGGWLRVTAAGKPGWVRLLHVSSQPAAAGGQATRELESAARVATGRAGTGNIAVTTGIRGLNTEELRGAQPDPAELQRLESYGADAAQANAYAAANRLERRQVPYPPAPSERRNAQP